MPEGQRLIEVIREKAAGDADAAGAFETIGALEKRYPDVYRAVLADANLRSMSAAAVLEKIALPTLLELQKATPPKKVALVPDGKQEEHRDEKP